jgi:predicted TIM-barrel fold metal-dependent hydrolase
LNRATKDHGRTAAAALPDGVPNVLIDCDVHNKIQPNRLAAYLPERWLRHYQDYGFNLGSAAGYTRPRSQGSMSNSWPPNDGLPGTDLAFMKKQLLDRWHHTAAILNPIDQVFFAGQYGEYAAALDRALNDWLAAEWLAVDDRLYGSISIPFEEPDLAVAEIDRCAGNPRFVQILVNLVSRDPLGNRKYWPIYEAAVHHDLPVAIHVAGTSGRPKSSVGWVSSYFEDHADYAMTFLEQVISLVAEGVFERFPGLKVVLQEGGFTWLPPLMWRMDRAYSLLHDDLPALEMLPSEYCRKHFWFTTQPIEEPHRPSDFMRVVRQLDMDDRFLFATDYPHWDFDAPDRAIPASVPKALRRQMFSGNALALYRGLPHPNRSDI